MSEKLYLDAQQLLEDSFRLGANIIEDGFRPSIMIAIWRGGVPMGIAIQELFAWYGIETDHISIRTSSYSGIDGRAPEIRIHGMNYLIKNCTREDSLLIVDDVFDTGLTIEAVIGHLQRYSRCGALLQADAQQNRARTRLLPVRNRTMVKVSAFARGIERGRGCRQSPRAIRPDQGSAGLATCEITACSGGAWLAGSFRNIQIVAEVSANPAAAINA